MEKNFNLGDFEHVTIISVTRAGLTISGLKWQKGNSSLRDFSSQPVYEEYYLWLYSIAKPTLCICTNKNRCFFHLKAHIWNR